MSNLELKNGLNDGSATAGYEFVNGVLWAHSSLNIKSESSISKMIYTPEELNDLLFPSCGSSTRAWKIRLLLQKA